jgi:RHS repeat-associated protein
MLLENDINGEGNMYSTEFRMFDARLGRWLTLDPLMDQFPWMSPFVGMDNNPISLTDPLGLSTIKDKEEKIFEAKNTHSEVGITAKKPSWMRIRINKFKNSLISFGKSNWREKYFGGLLSFRDKASGWASEQSSKMSEAVRQVDEIMKPYKDEKIKELKELYTIQAKFGGSGMASGVGINVGKAAKTVKNAVPSRLARVIPANVSSKTLGAPGTADVFVTAADDIAGLNASQIAQRLTIPNSSSGFRIIEFNTPRIGLSSPINRLNPGFVGFGRTAGGAREFALPNQLIPNSSIIRIVR